MAFKTITARFPGTCRRCGGDIDVGERIRYGGRGRTYHFAGACGNDTPREERYLDDPEYHRQRLLGRFDYRDEYGVTHLE